LKKSEPSRKRELTSAEKELRAAARRIARTPDGQLFLRWLMDVLGWKAPMLALKPGTQEIVENSTIYNVSKRDVWFQVRALLPHNLINLIEAERKEEDDDGADN
jgi:hypothetical protein